MTTLLVPLAQADAPLVAGWLARPESHRWLDFGRGRQVLDAVAVTMMRQSPAHHLRLIHDGARPVGVIGLAEISPAFGTAVLWYVIGDVAARGRGHASRAVAATLRDAFGELSLRAVQAWVVEENTASRRVLEKNAFRLAGRWRACHVVDDRPLDRLLFDRLEGDA
jgi:RimJ/RimL family protein N-acetyltransferase